MNDRDKAMIEYLTPRVMDIERQARSGCKQASQIVNAYKNVSELRTCNPALETILELAYIEYRAKYDK